MNGTKLRSIQFSVMSHTFQNRPQIFILLFFFVSIVKPSSKGILVRIPKKPLMKNFKKINIHFFYTLTKKKKNTKFLHPIKEFILKNFIYQDENFKTVSPASQNIKINK